MDLTRPLKYAFEDERWKEKLGIGCLIYMVPILNFSVIGWGVQIERAVAAGDPRPMPDWNDLGTLFKDGALLTLAHLLYSLPMMVVALATIGLAFLVGVAIAATGSGVAGILTGLAVVVLGGVFNWIYGFALSFWSPAIAVQYARWGTFGSCFAFSEMTALIRRNVSNYLTTWGAHFVGRLAMATVLPMVAMFLSFIPIIGSLLTMLAFMAGYLYLALVMAHLLGQLMTEDPGTPTPSAARATSRMIPRSRPWPANRSTGTCTWASTHP